MALHQIASITALVFMAQHVGASIFERTTCPTGQTVTNGACCELFPAIDLIQQNLFNGGECGEEAHASLNLAFHDAIGFSEVQAGMGGGADGSILEFACIELGYSENEEVFEIVSAQLPIFEALTLSAGDFIHLAAAVGISNCAGAPRLEYMLGRPPPINAASDGTIPEPTDSVSDILARFSDAGFAPQEVVVLLAAHTIGAAYLVDPSIPGAPFDSTPETFDTQMFLEVLLRGTLLPGNGSHAGEVESAIHGEIRLQSDSAFARDSRTACAWQGFVNNQHSLMTQFTAAMAKLQVLGQSSANLIDCSEVIPVPPSFTGPIKFPAGFSTKNIEQACATALFPTNIATVVGPAPTILPVSLE